MIKKLAVTISAVSFVMLAIALAPNVPAALATARLTTTQDDAKSNQPLAESCATFEGKLSLEAILRWFSNTRPKTTI